ncbi:MAG: IS1380 family transposase [Deltaproteobacteria bacterium]|nr:IS1380 family transposase [Deltaproteobacteria bacterium]
MQTECKASQLEFQGFGRRQVVASFDGGRISSDGGLLLLREVAQRTGLLERFARCFSDYRNPRRIEHQVAELVAQRVLALAQGYEDLNDHDALRDDPLLALAAGKPDLTGAQRGRGRDRGHALAGKSTLNRLERTAARLEPSERYKKIVYDAAAIEALFTNDFIRAHPHAPEELILDLDATDDPLHGQQAGRFFHGYYGCYCYLPLYIFCGDFLLCAKLRKSDRDGAAGALEEVKRIVGQLRAVWPGVSITVRADSGFAREELMQWCEEHKVDFIFGLARNSRLEAELRGELAAAEAQSRASGKPMRLFKDFLYQTRASWSRARRVVGKAEYLTDKANPRFVVTSYSTARMAAAPLYEELYCARGDMENRIKEQQLGLFADRTSSATMRANQLRLWFAALAYLLVNHLRHSGLRETELARAQVSTIRCRLLKIGARVTVSVRRVIASLSSAFPLQALFARVLANLHAAPALGP